MRPVGTFRRRFGKIIASILVTILTGFGLYHLTNWAFTIRYIEVVGENTQVVVDEKRISKNLLFFPSDVFREQILANNVWLADVRFEKKFPRTLRIIPVLRTPVAILKSDERVVLVSDGGIVIADGEGSQKLPWIIIPVGALRVGQTIGDKRVVAAVTLVTKLGAEMPISSVVYENNSYLRAKAEKLDIIIAQDNNIEDTMATLQMLLSGFRIKGTLPKVVDLRFDKPIVIF